MKTQLLFLFAFLSIFMLSSQTNGWYQYAQPKKIYDLKYDNAGNLHCGTDIGYIKLNPTGTVIDFKNLTSQAFPVGQLQQIAINPTNTNFLYAITDRKSVIEINLTTNVIKFPDFNDTLEDYTNNNFDNTKLYWAKSDVVYFYGESKKFYQTIENGVLSAKKDITFFPTAIIENNDGTKAYFASATKGLWELDTTNDTWTNYTKENSGLNNNGLTNLDIDSNDVLYMSNYGGLCSLNNGTFTSYEEQIPNSTLNYPTFQVDKHPTKNEVVVRTSLANSANQVGFATVQLNSDTWKVYKNDATNCFNENTLDHANYTPDGSKILAIQAYNGGFVDTKHVEFDPDNDTCTSINLNYSNASNINQYSNVNVRSSIDGDGDGVDGEIEVGFTNNEGFSIQKLPIATGSVSAVYQDSDIILVNENGTTQYDVLSAKNKFLVTNNQNEMQFVDEDNFVAKHSLIGIGGGGIINAKIPVSNSVKNFGIQQIILGSFNNGFERKIDIIDCDLDNNSCSEATEVFGNDRNLTSYATYGCTEKSDTELLCGIIKEDANSQITLELINYDISTKTSTLVLAMSILNLISNINRDIFFLNPIPEDNAENPNVHFTSNDDKQINKVENVNNTPTITSQELDENNDGNPEEIRTSNTVNILGRQLTSGEPITFLKALFLYLEKANKSGNDLSERVRQRFGEAIAIREGGSGKNNENKNTTEIPYTIIPDSKFDNLPEDLSIYKIIRYFNSTEDYTLILHTNYGLIYKPGINVSSSLNVDENLFTENKISVYPNPANDIIYFSNKTITSIEIFDINGRKVLNSETNSVSVKTLSKGIYIVRGTTSENISVSKKLIKN
jgi:hypothetical protein